MGGVESKVKNKLEKETTSSPNVKKIENFSEFDPRSPSENIPRTPLEVLTNSRANMESGSSSPNLLHVVDPRSPTDQFHRTPVIVKGFNASAPPSKPHNKLLDNARSTLMYTPTFSTKSHKGISQVKRMITPPKLLESSPISKKSTEKRRSFVGLLETNIDYTETNLDSYVKNKSLDSSLMINVQENGPGCVLEHENCDPRSPTSDFLRTPIQIVKKVGEIDLNNLKQEEISMEEVENGIHSDNTETLLKIVENNTIVEYSHNVVIENAGLNDTVVEKQNLELQNGELGIENVTGLVNVLEDDRLVVENSTEIGDEYDNHSVPIESMSEPKELIQEPIIDLTADILEFDKKLTKIIYEDSEPESKPLRDLQNDNNRNRTPMKDRNLNYEPKKNKLIVRDKPRKSEYAVSQIPVFKDKKGTKIKIQCENTPPNGIDVRRKRRVTQPKWDTDKTLVI